MQTGRARSKLFREQMASLATPARHANEIIKNILYEGSMSASAAKRARTVPVAPPPPLPPVDDGDNDAPISVLHAHTAGL